MMDQVDTLVIGAGVVGLAVARAIALTGREVMVIEKEKAIGQGVSSRNSEVVHGGLYYPTSSLKAKLCVRGKEMLYAYCAERGLPMQQCGKLIVATSALQLPKLAQIEAQAVANGVPVQRLTREQARALEPELECIAALHSPTTGIVSSHDLMTALQGDLENAGGMLALATEVNGIQFFDQNLDQNRPFAGVLSAQSAIESGVNGESIELGFKQLINAAGLYAPQLAQRMQGLNAAHIPQAHYAKGNYYSLSGKSPFRHLIYPIPSAAGLGVHITVDLGGQAKFGPDVEWLDGITNPEEIDYSVDPRRADAFYAEVRKYWPGLRDGQLTPSYSGVRPKIVSKQDPAADFLIQGQSVHGISGLVNLFGIESPGLTSALAIGEYVAEMLQK
ncbi:NAD(P)/FAD-dependent oxidoreductase [Variovorax sp. PCZ-1]|uniref:NAD(P)/FAD-dependent oxidoreductase n=1 Tax=Variovorax sp. PCZ-1 TaxID=2835533 RepID=UPI001BCFF864|nr:NAD(P)/FAD-dependent oxidoreductase [Variovorax sp. PCZ-1]MBS7808558.1 NAD(P)/FAD-dependent oxidoreductase [Variovorax sp. PCZ-1]